MSDIQRRIVTLFEARGAGQMRAALGQMAGGFGMFRRDIRDSRHELSLMDRQLRAMGTTTRYALAGGLLFGGANVLGQLSQIQQQLGLISAISPTTFADTGLVLRGEELRQFGESAEDAAFRAQVPITEFNEGLVNLMSTVQNVPENEVVPILEQIAQTARLSTTPVDEATKGITGLLVAFGQDTNLRNAQRILAEYQKLIFTVPGGQIAGPQVIQQLPQLAAVSRLSNLSPEQMFGLLTTSLRAGGSPATTARGLQYLIQGLAQPPSDEARKALAGIGITPEATQREGGVAALFRLIQAVRERGFGGMGNKQITSRLRGMTDEQLALMEEGGAGLGISGAGAELARTAVGRIHGVRALILLAAQQDQALKDLQMMANLGGDHAAQINELAGAWERFRSETQLQQATLAINQMAVDVAQAFEPILNFGGRGIVELKNLTDQNSDAFAYGLLGALGLGWMIKGRSIFKGVGPAHAAFSAAENLANPNATLGSSPLNPMFVAVVYSLQGRGPVQPPAAPGRPTPGGRTPPPRGWRSRIPGAKVGAGGAATALALLAPHLPLPEWATGDGLDPYYMEQWKRTRGRGMPRISNLLKRMAQGQEGGKLSKVEQDALMMAIGGNPRRANRLLEHVGGLGTKENPIRMKGSAEVTVKIDQPGQKPTRTKAVIDFVPDFTQTAPQTRGQPSRRRGG